MHLGIMCCRACSVFYKWVFICFFVILEETQDFILGSPNSNDNDKDQGHFSIFQAESLSEACTSLQRRRWPMYPEKFVNISDLLHRIIVRSQNYVQKVPLWAILLNSFRLCWSKTRGLWSNRISHLNPCISRKIWEVIRIRWTLSLLLLRSSTTQRRLTHVDLLLTMTP